MNTPFVDLQTERLRLRDAQMDDAAAITAWRSLPHVARYQSWERFTLDDACQMLAAQPPLAQPGSWFQLMMVERATNTPVGDLALHFLADDPQQVELGINLDPAFQQRGLALEAVNGVCAYLFQTMKLHRITAVTDAGNPPAARLFLQAGFRQEAHFVEHICFKGKYGSEYLFALLAREWHARRAA